MNNETTKTRTSKPMAHFYESTLASKLFFTSDLHLGHANVIKYCNRPFPDLETMNKTIIQNWNDTVQPNDTVFLLGDFAMGPRDRYPEYRSALNGRIILIRGNHDRSVSYMSSIGMDTFNDGVLFAKVNTKPYAFYMQHRPEHDFLIKKRLPKKEERLPGTEVQEYLHLCGHVHNEWSRKGPVINVGVDVRNFRPVSLEELVDSVE